MVILFTNKHLKTKSFIIINFGDRHIYLLSEKSGIELFEILSRRTLPLYSIHILIHVKSVINEMKKFQPFLNKA